MILSLMVQKPKIIQLQIQDANEVDTGATLSIMGGHTCGQKKPQGLLQC